MHNEDSYKEHCGPGENRLVCLLKFFDHASWLRNRTIGACEIPDAVIMCNGEMHPKLVGMVDGALPHPYLLEATICDFYYSITSRYSAKHLLWVKKGGKRKPSELSQILSAIEKFIPA